MVHRIASRWSDSAFVSLAGALAAVLVLDEVAAGAVVEGLDEEEDESGTTAPHASSVAAFGLAGGFLFLAMERGTNAGAASTSPLVAGSSTFSSSPTLSEVIGSSSRAGVWLDPLGVAGSEKSESGELMASQPQPGRVSELETTHEDDQTDL